MDVKLPAEAIRSTGPSAASRRLATRSNPEWPSDPRPIHELPDVWMVRAAHAARWVPEIDPTTRVATERLGREIAQLCVARGMSQRSLSARSGVSQATISRLMRGMTPGTRLWTVARILAALDGHVTGVP